MRYSPLVNRYLMNHNYETINNVREWKMKLIQRHQVQDDIDMKFKKFKQMARAAVQFKKEEEDKFETYKHEAEQKFQESCEQAKAHIEGIIGKLRDAMENGSYPEMTNMLLSIQRSNQLA